MWLIAAAGILLFGWVTVRYVGLLRRQQGRDERSQERRPVS
jgi:hypothetical protein